MCVCDFFFFKQKTAYEMRISDWSSDVCSSDLSGVIGFVGIVAPHLLRLGMGPDHRYLLPGCALLGGIVTVAADMVARTAVAPAELPIGIVAAAIGAPFFLWILLRHRGVPDLCAQVPLGTPTPRPRRLRRRRPPSGAAHD